MAIRRPRSQRTKFRWQRAGSAVVELAVCLPLIVTIVFASIEACNMMFLKQSLYAAAYEGTRVAIQKQATNALVSQRIQEVLDARQVSAATLSHDPADVASVSRGEFITVSVAAPCNANSISPSWFFGNRQLIAQCSMVKE